MPADLATAISSSLALVQASMAESLWPSKSLSERFKSMMTRSKAPMELRTENRRIGWLGRGMPGFPGAPGGRPPGALVGWA